MTRKRRKGKFLSSKTVRNHIQLEKARNDRLDKVTFDETLAIIDYDDNETESGTGPGDDHGIQSVFCLFFHSWPWDYIQSQTTLTTVAKNS